MSDAEAASEGAGVAPEGTGDDAASSEGSPRSAGGSSAAGGSTAPGEAGNGRGGNGDDDASKSGLEDEADAVSEEGGGKGEEGEEGSEGSEDGDGAASMASSAASSAASGVGRRSLQRGGGTRSESAAAADSDEEASSDEEGLDEGEKIPVSKLAAGSEGGGDDGASGDGGGSSAASGSRPASNASSEASAVSTRSATTATKTPQTAASSASSSNAGESEDEGDAPERDLRSPTSAAGPREIQLANHDDDDTDEEGSQDGDIEAPEDHHPDAPSPTKAREIGVLQTENDHLEEEIADTKEKIQALEAKQAAKLAQKPKDAIDPEEQKKLGEEIRAKLTKLDEKVSQGFKEVSTLTGVNKQLKADIKDLIAKYGPKTVQELEDEMPTLDAEIEELQEIGAELDEFRPMLEEFKAQERSKPEEGGEETHAQWLSRTEEELQLVREQSRNAILIAKAREAEYSVKGRKMRAMQEEGIALAAEVRKCRSEDREARMEVTMGKEEKRMDVERKMWRKQRAIVQKKIDNAKRDLEDRENEALRKAEIAEKKLVPARAALEKVQNKVFEADLKLQDGRSQTAYLRQEVEALGGRVNTAELRTPDPIRALPALGAAATPSPRKSKKGSARKERGRRTRSRSPRKKHSARPEVETGRSDMTDDTKPSARKRKKKRRTKASEDLDVRL